MEILFVLKMHFYHVTKQLHPKLTITKIFLQMTRSIHTTGEPDTVIHTKQMGDFMNQQFTTSLKTQTVARYK